MSFRDSNTTIQTAIKETSILKASNDHLTEAPAVTPVVKLKAKPKRLTGIWSLPFTASNSKKSSTPFWVIPATGGYTGGCRIGVLMAESYMKLLRDEPNNGSISYLNSISESIEARINQIYREDLKFYEQSDEYSSLRGQKVGFFNTLDQWLSFAAKNAGNGLDDINHSDQRKAVNKYLSKNEQK